MIGIRKLTSIIVLLVFITFTFSCNPLKQINLVKGESWSKNSRILTVYTKSGDLFEFSDAKPAKFSYEEIVGEAIDKTGSRKFVSIPIKEAKVIWIYSGSKAYYLLPLAILGAWYSGWLIFHSFGYP